MKKREGFWEDLGCFAILLKDHYVAGKSVHPCKDLLSKRKQKRWQTGKTCTYLFRRLLLQLLH
jgi:hypothetical protein